MISRRQWFAFLCFAPVLHARMKLDEDRVWKDFLTWAQEQTLRRMALLQQYRAKLISGGIPEPRAGQYMAVINRRIREDPEGVKFWFRRICTNSEPEFNVQPNAFMAEAVRDLRPATALDVAMGQGRNSLFLARQGWHVTGFDISVEGLAIARANAEKAGVKINAIEADYRDFDFGLERWDLVILIYAYVPIRNACFAKRIMDSLRPGGALIFEHRLGDRKTVERGPPRNPMPNELLRLFGDLRILHYEETQAVLDWPRGDGPTEVVRLLARKK